MIVSCMPYIVISIGVGDGRDKDVLTWEECWGVELRRIC